jgi:hypothetical protein
MALFAAKHGPAAARDDALDALYVAGDRLLSLRREALEATHAFAAARDRALAAVAAHDEAQRAEGLTPRYRTVSEQLPGWPSLQAGAGFLLRDLSGATALGYAMLDQERAERNWRTLAQRSRD